ncbi:BMC domain-containing protein, partial [Cloacibacillus porcorum]
GGKGFVTLTGDVGSVRAAVAAATKEEALLVSKTVIPRPSKQLVEKLI